MNYYELVARLLLGALLGGVIGFERHAHGRPAGLRTHILVCESFVLVMLVSQYYPQFHAALDPSYIRLDPIRLAAGAMTGVGFLGAGVIIKTGVTVQGLTTAASIWIVSAIGLAVGGGLYAAAVTAFLVTWLTLWTLRILEMRIGRLTYKTVTVTEKDHGAGEQAVLDVLERHGAVVENVGYERDIERGEYTWQLTVAFKGQPPLREIVAELSAVPSVTRVAVQP